LPCLECDGHQYMRDHDDEKEGGLDF